MNSEIQYNRPQQSIAHKNKAANKTANKPEVSILFVCLGNICRSPSAEGIFSHLANIKQTNFNYNVDSAAIADYHIGKLPDKRAIAAMNKQGLDISHQRCRKVCPEDFQKFDYIISMDERILATLTKFSGFRAETSYLMTDFFNGAKNKGVPDPFHGVQSDFDNMVDLLFECCGFMLDHIESSILQETQVGLR